MKHARARTDTSQIALLVLENLAALRQCVDAAKTQEADEALVGLETFCAVALRIMAKTNPSKVASEAMTTELALRLPRESAG